MQLINIGDVFECCSIIPATNGAQFTITEITQENNEKLVFAIITKEPRRPRLWTLNTRLGFSLSDFETELVYKRIFVKNIYDELEHILGD